MIGISKFDNLAIMTSHFREVGEGGERDEDEMELERERERERERSKHESTVNSVTLTFPEASWF